MPVLLTTHRSASTRACRGISTTPAVTKASHMAIVPSRHAVILRLGCTKTRGRFDDEAFLASVLAALPED